MRSSSSQGPAAVGRRALLAAAAGGFAGLLVPRRALGTLLRGLSLQELGQASEHILVVTPLEATSRWETLGGRRRIVTDTRVRVEDVIAQAIPPGGELWVRTLGGTVGQRAALVLGEATLFPNQASVLFTTRFEGAYRVLGMAQGHYPLRPEADRALRLTLSPRAPELVGDGEPAMRVLPGLELGQARVLIRAAIGQ